MVSERVLKISRTVLRRGGAAGFVASSVEDPRGIFSFVESEQIRNARFAGCLAIHPPRRACNPFPDLFSKHALRQWVFVLFFTDIVNILSK
jgi:hypothetical protein